MNEQFMNAEELEQIAQKYFQAVDEGDYREALECNHRIYESEYNHLRTLLQIKNSPAVQLLNSETDELEFRIKKILKNLDYLIIMGLELVDIKHNIQGG